MSFERGAINSVRAAIFNGDDLFLLKRTNQHRLNNGLWEFPGGAYEIEDLCPSLALEREVREETGFEIKILSDFIQTLKRPLKEDPAKFYLSHVVVAEYLSGDFELSEEHVAGIWVPRNRAENMPVTLNTAVGLSILSDQILMPR